MPIHLYAAQVDVLREQAIQNYRAGQTQQAVSQLDQLLNKYPHDQKLLADYLFIRPLAKVVIASSSDLPVQRLS
nr:hypothetical protein [Acinetobacter baumannii]